jgi:D-3-phosphoglycerate dehydrogenase
MMSKKILITCPPMIENLDNFHDLLNKNQLDYEIPDTFPIVTDKYLETNIGRFDGWIVGDDWVSSNILKAGSSGNLKALVKWGVGIDNIDINACKKLNLKFAHTPNMFGKEVADVAIGYLISLSRKLIEINNRVKNGDWPKLTGNSLQDKTVGLIGYGDIGQETAIRLNAMGMNIICWDPGIKSLNKSLNNAILNDWPKGIEECDYIILTCSLNKNNKYILNKNIFKLTKPSLMIVNVSRGGLINEKDLLKALDSKQIASVALDVFESEPVRHDSPFLKMDSCIFGSHNSSNTIEGVIRASNLAINLLNEFLEK